MSKYPIPFGRHLLLERINVGGMAEVFRAKSFGVEGFERIVAVKRILPTLADDEEFITMFIDEARIAAHLTHQNIVQIFELNRAEKTFFISMEYVAGHDLRLILDHQKKLKRPMEVPKAAFIVSRVAEALEYAHRKRDPAGRELKIIHRDVTPQNVIISFEGEVKLCDFGIAKAATRVSRTQVGVLKGKFAYMSPEQVRGQPTDRRSDIFALGVIFYEMLTGERLFLGESDYATLDSVRQAVIPPPSKYNPNLSPGLEAVLLKMLAKDPKERYQWASEVHEDLLDHLTHDGKRPYHSRHLRAWMQETYARDVETENGKLEEFMRLRMPAELEGAEDDSGPEPVPTAAQAVAELAEKSVAADPADLPRRTDDFQDATDAIPAVSAKARSPAPKGPVSSPVAHLYGAAELEAQSDEAKMVMPSGLHEEAARASRRPSHPTTRLDRTEDGPIEEPSMESERTQYDMIIQPGTGGSRAASYDPEANDTMIGGELEGEISAAQAELIAQLDREGALDTGDTVDASDDLPDDFEGRALPEVGAVPDGLTLQGDEDEPMGEVTPLGEAPTFVKEGFGAEATSEGRGRSEPAPGVVVSRASPTGNGPVRARPSAMRAPRGEGSGWGRGEGSAAGPPWERPGATLPPNLGTPYVPPHFEVTPEQAEAAVAPAPIVQAAAPRNPRLVVVLAGGVALLTAVLLVVVFLALGPSEASLEINTSPTQQVEVKLDGKVVARQTPALVPALALGEHRVELSAVGFRGHVQTIQIAEPKPHTMVVPLEAAAAPPPPPSPAEEELPPGAPVEDAPPPPPPPPPPAAAPAKAAETASPLGPPTASAEAPRPVAAPPPPTVRPAGGGPTQTTNAAAARPKLKAKPQGAILVSTTPQGVEVWVDGKKTGLRTPIRQPYALPAGKHQITFVLADGASYNFEVVVNEGEVTKLIKPLR